MKVVKSSLNYITIVVITLFALFLFSSCEKKPDTKKLDTLNIGGHTTIFGTVLEVGKDMGIFSEHGLDVTVKRVRSSKESMAALVGGSLDIVLGTAAAGNLNLVNKSNLYIIADAGSIVPQLVVRQELVKDGSIKSLSDFKGRTVSVPRKGSASWYAMNRILKSVNLDIDDISAKYLRQKETIAALAAGHVDAAILSEPNTTISIEKGLVVLFKADEIAKLFPANGQQYTVLYTTERMINNAKVLKKFLKAYLESINIYENGRKRKQPEFDQVVNIIHGFTQVPVEIIKKAEWPSVSLDGKPNMDYIIEMHDVYVKKGLIADPVDFSKASRIDFLDD